MRQNGEGGADRQQDSWRWLWSPNRHPGRGRLPQQGDFFGRQAVGFVDEVANGVFERNGLGRQLSGRLDGAGVLVAERPEGGNFSTPSPITIGTNGAVIDSNSYDVLLTGPLAGLGGLTKIGAGSVTLSGVNNYTGGTAVLSRDVPVIVKTDSGLLMV